MYLVRIGFVFITSSVTFAASQGQGDCARQLQASTTTVDLPGKSVDLENPFTLDENCRRQLFRTQFPSEACNLGVYPTVSSGEFAEARFTREASIVGLKRIVEAGSLTDLGLAPVWEANSVDLGILQSLATLLLGRVIDKVDGQCRAVLALPGDPLTEQVKDYSLIFRLREILRAAPARKYIVWPADVISPGAFLSRPDSRHYVDSLFQAHLAQTLALQIQDLQIASLDIVPPAAPPSQSAATPSPTIPPQPVTIATTSTTSTTTPLPEVGSGNEAPGPDSEQGGQAEDLTDEERSQKAKDREEFAAYTKNVPIDQVDTAIATLKELKRIGALYPPPAYAPAPQGSFEFAIRHNPVFQKVDQREAQEEPEKGGSADVADGIRVLGEEVTLLREDLKKHKDLLEQRVSELTRLVDTLSRENIASQREPAGANLQVTVRGLVGKVSQLSSCCGLDSGRDQSSTPEPSKVPPTFYSLDNIVKVSQLLSRFVDNYRWYRGTIGVRSRRAIKEEIEHNGGEEQSDSTGSGQTEGVGEEGGPFPKLERTGNIFFDSTQQFLALNDLISAYNNYSPIFKKYHHQEPFQASNYVQTAKDLYGSIPIGKVITEGNATLGYYKRIIAAVQRRYPSISECCATAYFATALTGLLTIFGLIAAFCYTYCERQDCKGCVRCKAGEGGCGCCGGGSSDRSHGGQEYRPAQNTPSFLPRTEPGISRQRDATAPTQQFELIQPLLEQAPAPPVPDWSTMQTKQRPDTRV